MITQCTRFATLVTDLEFAAYCLGILVILFATFLCIDARPRPSSKQPCTSTNWLRILQSESFYRVALVVGIVTIRSPTWLMGETDLDESQWLAGTLTLRDDFALFGRVTGGSSGPVVLQSLYLWVLLVGEASYEAAKVFSTLIWIGIILASYASLRFFCTDFDARIMTSSLALGVAFFRLFGYVGYNGEHISILLLSWAVFHVTAIGYHDRNHRLHACFLGIALGLLPYAKLQSAPIGVVVGLWGLLMLKGVANRGALVLTVLAMQSLVFGYLYFNGRLENFLSDYLMQNVAYTSTYSEMKYLVRLYYFLPAWWNIGDGRELLTCFLIFIFGGAAYSFFQGQTLRRRDWIMRGASLIYVSVAAFVIAQPGTFFEHYYLFMIHPVFMAAAVFAFDQPRELLGATEIKKTRLASMACTAILLSASTVPGFIHARSEAVHTSITRTNQTDKRLSNAIVRLAHRTTKLSVWGWAPKIYVETQLPQATDAANTMGAMVDSPYRDDNLRRHVAMLKKHEDLIFVDSTGLNGYSYKFKEPKFDHSHFALLNEFVTMNLEYVDTIDGNQIFRTRKNAKKESVLDGR